MRDRLHHSPRNERAASIRFVIVLIGNLHADFVVPQQPADSHDLLGLVDQLGLRNRGLARPRIIPNYDHKGELRHVSRSGLLGTEFRTRAAMYAVIRSTSSSIE